MNRTTCNTLSLLFTAALCCALLQLCLPAEGLSALNASVYPLHSQALKNLEPDFRAKESFNSHLPVLVIEMTGQQDPVPAGAAARLSVLDNGPSGENSLPRGTEAALDVLLKVEPGQPAAGKKSYIVELTAKDGKPFAAKVSLAGLPEDRQWRLQGSTRDRGMLRNGLAYAFGRLLFPHETPETRYCEVFLKTDGQYRYEGLYLLVESMAKRLGGETLLEYSPREDMRRAAAGQASGDEAVFGWSLQDRGFSIVHPRGGGDEPQKARMEMELDQVESALRSLKPDSFLTYLSLLDQDSAIDFYILNSLLLNAHESAAPLFISKETGGKLHFSPVWNFNEAIDNGQIRSRPLPFESGVQEIASPSILARRDPVWRQLENGGDIKNLRHYPVFLAMDADHFLWFDRLFLSRPFLMGLFSRYHELRRGPLSPEQVSASVDNLAESLGPALERDWRRWEKEYASAEGPFALEPYVDQKGQSRIRQTFSYDQELVKIRDSLRGQDAFLMGQMAQLDWISADLFDEATSGNRQAAYALAAIIAFLFLTYMLTRKL